MNYKAYTLFMYNIAKNVEWPENDKKVFTIGVLGNSPLINELEALAKNKNIHNKQIVIKQFSDYSLAGGCDILYITSSKSSALKLIAMSFGDQPILIISEREGLTKKGACISFFADDLDKLSFEINAAQMKTRKLKASASLLQLGEEVN